MIHVIGLKRVLILFILVAVNGFFAALLYGYLVPENQSLSKKVRTVQAQVGTVRSDIERMQVEFEMLGKQQGRFDLLKKDGFLDPQDRANARATFSLIQKQSKVISAVANVEPGEIIDNEEAQKSNHKILVSPIEVKVSAFDDSDIFRYLFLLDEIYPGHISIDRLEIKRVRDVTPVVLRAITTGANPELVSADIKLLWRTMIPEAQVLMQGGKQ